MRWPSVTSAPVGLVVTSQLCEGVNSFPGGFLEGCEKQDATAELEFSQREGVVCNEPCDGVNRMGRRGRAG